MIPDNKVHEANMGPTWVLSAPGGPHVVPINLAVREILFQEERQKHTSEMSYGSTLTGGKCEKKPHIVLL